MGSHDHVRDEAASVGRRGDRFGALTWLPDEPAAGLVSDDPEIDLDGAPAEGLVGAFDGNEPAMSEATEAAPDDRQVSDESWAHEPADDVEPADDIEPDLEAGVEPDVEPVTAPGGASGGGAHAVPLGGVAGEAVASSGDEWRSPRPLPAALPPRKRRWPKVLAALVVLGAIGGGVAALASRDRDDRTGSSVTTAAAAASTTTTGAAAATTAAATGETAATASTAVPTSAATTTATAPATSAVASTAAGTSPTTQAAGTVAPAAADDAVDLFTPVRWAIFDKGKVQLLGRVPSQAAADTIAAKAAGVVGKDNVQVGYTIDPAAPLPPSAPLYVKDLVLFGENSAALQADSYGLLDLGVTLMQQNPAVRIRVVGRADNRGDPNKNLLLSLDRAQSVIDYVVAKGIDRTRLTPVPLGSEAAVGDNSTPEGQAQNRSVAFVITGLLA